MVNEKKSIRDHKDRAFPEPDNTEKARVSDYEEKAAEKSELAHSSTPGFPIVGIGASAGALSAFKAFFSGLPAETEPGMAFVLVQHLAPDHKSILSELLKKFTRLQVYEVEDGMVVQPNRVYVIPPNRDIALMNGSLQLLEPALPSGHRLPIDFFFRTLAQDRHELAIGIVLSGTGSDGTLGVRAIKGEGGMVMAQDIDSAEYDGMPRSAIATGLVDYELPPAEMFSRLGAYVTHSVRSSSLLNTPTDKTESTLNKILILLRNQTGHDFSQYKQNCIQRRVERRMIIHQINTIERYLKYIQQTPKEVEILFKDMMIGVTNFFRDPEAFKVLEDQVIPKIFADRSLHVAIRVWVPGCSTGEEAYSIAILLAERQEKTDQSYKVRIFATDIDAKAIATARAGIYPASIAIDISEERLKRFFIADGSTYRINKTIREMLVFSEHSLIKDPPFSKLDLISCRNLLIYLGGELQKKVIPVFHYALSPKGFLFLGTSENVADFNYLFAGLDRKLKLYQRKEHVHTIPKVAPVQFLTPRTSVSASRRKESGKPSNETPMRKLTEQALLQRAPAAVLVDNQGDILYFHGRTGMYLEPPLGEGGVSNIFQMARKGLRYELVTALHKAEVGKEIVHYPGLRVKNNGDFNSVDLTVQPVTLDPVNSNAFLYLVVMEVSSVQPGEEVGELEISEEDDPTANALIARLRQELSAKEEYLQAIREKLETANDDLRSRNEEMRSVIEELQSTNEELETSTEELQSVNEEINSINNELQTNMFNLSQANDDMSNMLGGTGIGIIFVDHKLQILRYTPTVTQIINLIPGDVGRPVAHIVSNLVGYDSLAADAKAVLDTLIPKEVEVQTSEGKWSTLRIKPYRTSANVIEGAVITFMDITEIKQDREALREANDKLRLAIIMRDAYDAITVQDLDGRIIAWNQGAVRKYGWSEAEALTMNASDRIPEELQAGALADIYRLSLAQKLEPCRTQRLAKDGMLIEIWLTSTALVNEEGKMYAIMTTERSGQLELDPITRAVKYYE
ncbi:MAG: chemotaxis protein CheB [Desulfopila sp.]